MVCQTHTMCMRFNIPSLCHGPGKRGWHFFLYRKHHITRPETLICLHTFYLLSLNMKHPLPDFHASHAATSSLTLHCSILIFMIYHLSSPFTSIHTHTQDPSICIPEAMCFPSTPPACCPFRPPQSVYLSPPQSRRPMPC